LIHLGHDYYDDTPPDDLEVSSEPSSPIIVAPSLDFSIVRHHFERGLTIHDPFLSLAPLGELDKKDGFETNASFIIQRGIRVE